MNAAVVAVVSVILFYLALRFYGRFLSGRVFCVDNQCLTPAHRFNDGVDYVPARKPVLFGHHFASIAGLGPIAGPAIAVIWGWLPAVIWIILGAIFMGAVHDYGALCLSLRHEGSSIGDLTGHILGPRGRILFLVVSFFLLALAMGVFALIVAQLFAKVYPEAVIPVFALMLIAVAMGWAVYKFKVNIAAATVGGLLLMFAGIWYGLSHPVSMHKAFLSPLVKAAVAEGIESGELADDSRPGVVAAYLSGAGLSDEASAVNAAGAKAVRYWIFILLAYALVASVLPVWLLLQPRDYLNSYQLYLGLGGLFLGALILHPKITAPAFNTGTGAPPLIPILFITVACGAISGFHSLVSSGTTARQLNKPADGVIIAYGGMLTEGLLAIMVILACVAGVGSYAGFYSDWGVLTGSLGSKIAPFFEGGGKFLGVFGIAPEFGAALLAVVVVGFAMTTLDSGTRLLRYNIEEFADTIRLKRFVKRYIASIIAVLALAAVALWEVPAGVSPDGATVYKPAGLILWTMFGTTNQLMASLALLVVTVYLIKARRPSWYTAVPFAFMLVITGWAMIINILEGWNAEDPAKRAWSVVVVGALLIIVALWLAAESLVTVIRARREEPTEIGPTDTPADTGA